MDLVDIDKVLDDLEFDENEVTLANISQTLNHHNIANISTTETKTTAPTFYFQPNSAESCNMQNSFQLANHSRNIGVVSQVFDSLDEYRSDVQSLRIGSDDISTKDSFENINQIQQENAIGINAENMCSSTMKSTNSNNLGKMIEYDDSIEGLTSSSSITTSSPSSFSSGPSPRSPLLSEFVGDDELNEIGYEYDEDDDLHTNHKLIKKLLYEKHTRENFQKIDKTLTENFNNLSYSTIMSSTDTATTNNTKSQHAMKQKIQENMEHQNAEENEKGKQVSDEDENIEYSNRQNSLDLVGFSLSSNLCIENSELSLQPETSGTSINNLVKIKNKYANHSFIVCKNFAKDESNNRLQSSNLVSFKSQVEDEDSENSDDIVVQIKDGHAITKTVNKSTKNSDLKYSLEHINGTEFECKDKQYARLNSKISFNIEDKSNNSDEFYLTNVNDIKDQLNKVKIDYEEKQQDLKQKKQVLPITFSSTMDEISDTELDSMLQNIDNELQITETKKDILLPIRDTLDLSNEKHLGFCEVETEFFASNDQDLLPKPKCFDIMDAKVDKKIGIKNQADRENNLCNNEQYVFAQATSTYDIETTTECKLIYVQTADDDNNIQNADSFSQASTVEFTELQSQNDLRMTGTNSGCISETRNDNFIVEKNEKLQISSESTTMPDEIKDINIDGRNGINNIGVKQLISLNSKSNLHIPTDHLMAEDMPLYSVVSDNTCNLIEKLNNAVEQNQVASALPSRNQIMTSLSNNVSPTKMDSSVPIESTINHKDDEYLNNSITVEYTGSGKDTSKSNRSSLVSSKPSLEANTKYQLGKVPPFWIPDSETSFCMQCKVKFSLIKRRHHCRACGQVLCSFCCSQKAKLEFLGNENEVRVCVQCFLIINNIENNDENCDNHISNDSTTGLGAVGGEISGNSSITNTNIINYNNSNVQVKRNLNAGKTFVTRSPNPNNPMEYCSTIPPHEQVKKTQLHNVGKPISVMVPVGVLKREGQLYKNQRKDKNVIFSDGIRPGCDLADLDNCWLEKGAAQYNPSKKNSFNKDYMSSGNSRILRKQLPVCDEYNSYIPKEINALPPIYEKLAKTNEYDYKEVSNNSSLIERLQKECLKFAVQRNFFVYVKIVKLTCCINKTVINFTTHGMQHVGQDEIVILLEYDKSSLIPKDIFIHLNEIYRDADKGHPTTELGYTIAEQHSFLGSTLQTTLSPKTATTNGGFLYIRSTFQCLQEIKLPDPPFLIGILIHRWEIPWAKIFPLRLMLRLGAQFRYYPSPHVSIKGRKSVYAEIAQTIINFLADFRNYSYSIPIITGMLIHMEDRKTSVLIPKNRHDQVIKAINNSSDHILALSGNFSKKADGHLVCIQNLESNCPDTHTYSTQAINIQGQPRRVTGASFIVFNGALKSNSGLSGKCSIVEDGLMVHILSQKMQSVRKSLKNMQDIDIRCGPIDGNESQTEIVAIQWVDDDEEFNIGVKSPIDDKPLDGVASIRVHSGFSFSNSNYTIRWTEVFLIQTKSETMPGKISLDISKLSEEIARSASTALVPLLDLLVASACVKISLRVTLHQENVCYEAGSNNFKLAPLYMNALDNELIPILHKQATMYEINNPIILELIFHILYN